MKLITRNTDYAIRAICFIAKQKGDIVSVSELVKQLSVPRPFLRKILQLLDKKKILRSYKGKGGGFVLNVSAREIYLVDLIKIFQGTLQINECIFKKYPCPNIGTCRFKKKIDKIQYFIVKELKKINILSLLRTKE